MFNETPTKSMGNKTLSFKHRPILGEQNYISAYLTHTLVGDISVHNPVFYKRTLKTFSILVVF